MRLCNVCICPFHGLYYGHGHYILLFLATLTAIFFFFSCEHVVVVFSLFDRYIAAGAGLPLHPQHHAVTSNSTERAQSSRGWERLGAWALGGRHTL